LRDMREKKESVDGVVYDPLKNNKSAECKQNSEICISKGVPTWGICPPKGTIEMFNVF